MQTKIVKEIRLVSYKKISFALILSFLNYLTQVNAQLYEYQVGTSSSYNFRQIGQPEDTQSSEDWDEFTSRDASPTYNQNIDNINDIRPWIGHSTCNICEPGTSKYQRFELDSLQIGQTYVLNIHPAFVTGNKVYKSEIVDGMADIIFGSFHWFTKDGYFNSAATWRIEFKAHTSSVTLEIGNDLTSGDNYLYFDWFSFREKSIRIAERDGAYLIGSRENFDSSAAWDEFQHIDNVDPTPNHIVGSNNLETIRPWIGHSECSSCNPGTAKKQRLTFNNLIPEDTYWLTVYPAYVTGTAYYSALVTDGDAEIKEGNIKRFDNLNEHLNITHRWKIEFVPKTTSITLDLGHGLTSGNHYIYINWYAFTPDTISFETFSPEEFSDLAKTKDIVNGGDWFKDSVYSRYRDRYLWHQAYVMNSYNYLYELTHDDHWLEKLITHADAVLAQRNNITGNMDFYGEFPPTWEEQYRGNGGYSWIGFTGALFDPIIEFAVMVLENPYLSSQPWLENKALQYVADFQLAVDHHEAEWVENTDSGFYIFPDDLVTQCNILDAAPLVGQPVANNYGSLIVGAVLDLAKAYRARGDARADIYFDRVFKYAHYFRSTWTYEDEPDRFIWPFSSYYEGSNDIGHANFDIRFINDCFQEGIVYSDLDMERIANTFDYIIEDDYAIPYNIMDATFWSIYGDINNTTYYWNFVAPYKDGLFNDANIRARLIGFPFVDFISLAYIDYQFPQINDEEGIVSSLSDYSKVKDLGITSRNYPNPFSSSTIIEINLKQAKHIKLSIVDSYGRQISKLTDKKLSQGLNHFEFNLVGLPRGVYFYQVEYDGFIHTGKMLLID